MKISKFKRKVIIILSLALLLLIMAGVIISSLFLSKTNKKEIQSVLSAEMKRSMTYADVQPGESATSSQYVTFDVFSLKDTNGDGIAEAKRGTCNEIGKQDTMYFELRVNDNGYLKDGVITIDSKNFYLNTAIVKDSVVKNNYISNNTKVIEFNNIQNGSQRLFTGIIRSGDYSDKTKMFDALKQNKNNYSKVNSVTLTGIHVSDDNVETPISKTVNFDVDWYGETTASIDVSNIKNLIRKQDLQEDEDINLEFTVTTSENSNELLLSSADIEGIIPDLNGFKPKSLFFENSDITYNFDSNTGVFHASNTATVDSRGLITKQCYDTTYYDYHNVDKSKRYNEWKITVTYPRQALEMGDSFTSVQLIIPMKVTYTGFNNNNSEFENPYISDIARTSLVSVWIFENSGETLDFGTYIGKKVYSPYERRTISKAKPLKILNEISDSEDDDFYEVRWFVHSGIIDEENNGVELAENIKNEHTKADRFIKADGTVVSMENYTTNAGIYFEGISDLLGEDGWIKIYNDDTNTEIVTLTSSNWNEEYWYENPVKHIRIKTSKINEHSALTIVNIKELNDLAITNDFGMAGFEELEHIDTNLAAYGIDNNTNKITSATADYEEPYSIALISADKAQVSTQQTDENPENIVLKISTESYNYNEQKWKNGTFLIKMPEDVIEVREITSITVDNPDVEIANYELYEENGNYFIKIDTENDEETTFNILVDVSIVPNPRLQTKTEIIELYAKNEQGSSYLKSYSAKDIYDLDLNGNVEERVSRNVLYISFVSPNSLLTSQQTRKGDEEATIAPRVAKIDKEQRKATIDVNITNNYTSDITDVVIQGVIPFRGNKYILTDGDLGSQYDTTMSDGGISIDVVGDATKDISTYTTIYYSTKEKPTNNLTDPTNNWVQANQVTDWSEIKSYAISLGNYKLSREESHTFSYEINIPDGLEYNDISYSEHGIYFALMTEAGKYYTSTAANKLGFMIAKQYDLEIEKYQENTTKKLPNISFKITEDGESSGSVRKTNGNGLLELGGLFAERKYKIVEYKTTEDYCLNDEEIELYTYTDEDDNLYLTYKNADGTYSPLQEKYSWIRAANVVQPETEDYKVHLEIEDEVKAKLQLHKTGEGTPLRNAKFSLSGKGINNLILQTDEYGNLSTSGLFVDEEYTLTEIKAEGYYVNSGAIRFKIASSGINQFSLQILENSDLVTSSNLTMQDSIPTVNLVIDDEKIPTYNFEVIKYAEHEEGEADITLQGAQFILQGDGLSDNGIILTTDENGKINIEGLYEYVEENGNPKGNISAIYTLKEIYAPNGYALDQTEIKFKATRNQSGVLEVEVISGSDRIRKVTANEVTENDINVTNGSTSNPTVSIGVEDPPIFELIKVDENNNPVEGAKFEIYSIDEEGNSSQAIDLNGNEIGVCTTNSNGKIFLNLPEGLYKAVEVETLDRFEFDENEANRTKFFGIGASKPAESEFKLEWTSSVAQARWDTINSVYPTADGGVIAAGSFYDQAVINNDEESQIQGEGYKDGIVIKYSQDGTIEWYRNIGGSADDEITKIIQTSDGGYALIGNMQSKNINIDSAITVNGLQDGIIIKLNANGQYEWSKVIGGELDDYLYSINEDSNGNLIVTGGYSSSQIDLPNGNTSVTISNLGKMDGFVASYSSNGNTLNWYQKITGTNSVKAVDSIEIPSGYVVAVNYIGTINLENNNVQTQSNYATATQDIVLIWYNADGSYNKKLRIGGTGNDRIAGLINYDDGILAYGEFVGDIDANDNSSNDYSSNGNMDNFLFKYSANGDFEQSNSMTFGGTLDEGIGQVAKSGNDLILGGWTYSAALDVNGDGVNEISKSANNCDSYVIRLNKTANGYAIDKFYRQAGSNDEEGRTVCATTDGGFVIGGATSSATFTIEGPTNKAVTGKGYSDGFIAKYNDVINSPEYAEQQQIKFTNEYKKYNITTELHSVDAANNYSYDIGGTITGDYGAFNKTNYSRDNHIKYVETVKYHENATKNISIVPEEGYMVSKITINEELYDFTPENDGKVIIPAFESIEGNKHISVELVRDYSQIVVKHLLWTEEAGTTQVEIADGYTQTKAIGTQYSTSPAMDLEDYEMITNKEYYGNKTEQQICQILGINSLAEINYNSLEEFQNDYYIPQNASGTYREETQTIEYYYKEKTYFLQVEHLIYGTNEKVPDINGNEVETIYTDGYRKFIDDETTPESRYETTRSDRVDYTVYELVADSGNTSGTITQNTIVKYFYRIKDAQNVIVHHYIVGTENKVPSSDGNVVEDQTYPLEGIAKVGDSFETQNAEEQISQIYRVATNKEVYGDELPSDLIGKENNIFVPENYRGNYTDQVQEVTYYYSLKPSSVLVHHYIEGTTNKVPNKNGGYVEDETITGRVTDEYTTFASSNIPVFYELVEEPENKEGRMILEPTVVTYQYRLKKYSYVVNYLEKGTNNVLRSQKTVDDVTYGTEISSQSEEVAIEGYIVDSKTPNVLTVSEIAENNVINIYYTKRTDLSYVVNYLEKDNLTNVLLEPETKTGKTYKDIVNAVDEVVEIDGYVYNSADPETIEIEVSGNEINLLYVRRNDLKYHVNYIDVETNESIKETKTVPNKTYEETIMSSTEIIDIDGYTFDSVAPESIQIIVEEEENEINIYYTKRTDLQYTVNYIDKDTDEPIQSAKTQGDMTFGDVVTASSEKITIPGYNYDSASTPSITIGTTAANNVIDLYYTKKTDIGYIVRHYEKGTTTEIANYDTYNDGVLKSKVVSASKQKTIDGYIYDYANPVELEISAQESENVIKLYYQRRNDLQYTVNYLDKATNQSIQTAKVATNQVFDTQITALSEKITIPGYNYDSANPTTIRVSTTAANNVINLYYTKRTDLSYVVNYLEKDNLTNILLEPETKDGKTFKEIVNAIDEVVEIAGYVYNSADPETLEIDVSGNVINLLYVRRNDLKYHVNYIDVETNEQIKETKTVPNKTYEETIMSSTEIIDIDGYTFDSVAPESIQIIVEEEENEINIYYTKRTDLQYTVNYIDKDTDEPIQSAKTQGNMTFGEVVTASSEKITIPGYNYDSASTPSITIGTSAANNVIDLYYTKKTNIKYTVKHYEKGTTTEIATADTYNDGVLKSKVVSASKQKTIDGYTYYSADPVELEIKAQESQNIINLYYERRHDLQYTVNYIDKDTNEEIKTAKTQGNMTFGDVVTASSEVVTIAGYNYDSASVPNITIGTTADDNVINLYYTKKTDIGYTVRHYEKGTTTEIATADTYNDGVFKSKVVSASKQKEIDGYTYDYANPVELEISAQESQNIINLYYERRHDLQYTVNYIDKDTNEEIRTAKTQGNKTFGDVVTASSEVITIAGYNYDSASTPSITIGTNAQNNVINLYYTKKTDLGYTVRHYEKGTTTEIAVADTYNDGVFKSKVISSSKQKAINGYTYDSANPEELEIKADTTENIINLYYTRRDDLSYIVRYVDKDTNESIQTAKMQGNKTFGDVVVSSNEIVEIAGYNYDSASVPSITIGTNGANNVITLYYTKKTDLGYIVKHLEKGTTTEIADADTYNDGVFKSKVISSSKQKIIDGYTYYSANPVELEIKAQESENIIKLYYQRRNDLQYTVNYIDKDTNETIKTAKTQGNKTLGDVVTASNEVVTIAGYNYDSASVPSITIGTNGANNVITLYYTKKTDIGYTVRHYEKGTTAEIADADTYNDGVFKSKVVSSSKQKAIDGYTYDSANPVELEISAQESENVINLYYQRRNDLQYTVNYLDKDTNEEIQIAKEQGDKTFGDVIISSNEVITIAGYNYDSASVPSITIGTNAQNNVINLYYTKKTDLSYIVRHYEKGTTTEIATADTYNDGVFKSKVVSSSKQKAIDGYIYDYANPVELEIKADEAENVINLYYERRHDLQYTVKYLDKDTNEEIQIAKEQGDKTFGDVVTASNEVITIAGYNYDSASVPSITIGTNTEDNVINLYYTKKTDIGYIVRHYEKGTTTEIATADTYNNGVLKSKVVSASKQKTIDGYIYDYANPVELEIKADDEENVINLYYERRHDLQYTVKYLDKDTNEEIQTAKVATNQVFDTQITALSEKITIPGYNYDSANPTTIRVSTNAANNVINLYYTKRTDLSYIVNYLEKDNLTNILLEPETKDGKTFKEIVNAIDEVVEIAGYVYNSADPETLEINVEENVINLLYVRRNDLKYHVNYIDIDTNEQIKESKTVLNKTYEETIISSTEIIDIDGYTYDSVAPESIQIIVEEEENEINIYYTKRKDLQYTVNYIDKDTDEPIQSAKIQRYMTFGDVVTASSEKITIPGYNYDSESTPSITIGTNAANNVITLYYTKKTDIGYIVRHYEKGTTTEIAKYDTYNDGVLKSKVLSASKQKTIDGYTYYSADPVELEIKAQESENIIKLYYQRRNDLQYTVNYLDKDTNEEIKTAKEQGDKTFGDVITASSEVVTIAGYNYDSASVPSITIGTNAANNVITLYYTKKTDIGYIVRHYEKGTTTEIANYDTYNDGVFKSKVVSLSKQKTIDGYTYYSADPVELEIKAQESENIIKLYYQRRHDLQYTVRYLDKDTNEEIQTAKEQGDKTFGDVVISSSEVITIAGYNYDSASVSSITIGTNTDDNVINLYYTKKTDIGYTVRHYEKGTTTEIATADTYNDGVFKSKVVSSSKQKAIDGYIYDYANPVELEIKADETENIIKLYYVRRNDLSYIVRYVDKNTSESIQTAKMQGNKTFGDVVVSSSEIVDIAGYNYESASTPSITIGTNGANNVITLYYTKKTDISYTVRHLEKGTEFEIADSDTYNDGVFKSKIESASKQKEIDGYTYDRANPVELEINAQESQNIINLYYERRHDLQYTVNYIDKDTNEEIRIAKTQGDKTFGDIVTSSNEVITIAGYNYDSASTPSITIGTNEANNVITLYYTKKTDIGYIVRHYEKGTTTEIANYDTYNDGVFKSKVVSESKQKEIDGYTYDSADPVELEIKAQESENIINLYYERRHDLQYTVNYIDKDTNEEIRTAKTQGDKTFGDVVSASSEKITIPGYNYDSASTPSITIGTNAGNNVITLYYTKKTDLGYIVKHYEKGTEAEIADYDTYNDGVLKSKVVSSSKQKEIDGYTFDSADPVELEIKAQESENIINLYYERRHDLQYTVNYIDKSTNEEIKTAKLQENMTFGDVVIASSEVITIAGYNYDSASTQSITIGTNGANNVINLYYTKREDLNYTVKYYDKDTNEEIKTAKVTGEQIYDAEILAINEKVTIPGYNYDSASPETIRISTNAENNIINLYYTKRTDLSYVVNYLEKDNLTNILLEPETKTGKTFKKIVNSVDEVVEIVGYVYNSADPETLEINVEGNVINLLYVRRNDLKYHVNYIDVETNEQIKETKIVPDKTYEETIMSSTEIIDIDGYTFDSVAPESIQIIVEEEENEINIYYTKRTDLQYTVNYIDKDTNESIQEPKLQGNMIFGDEVIASNEVITIAGYNYDSASTPSITIGTNGANNVINLYYTKKTDLSYIVKHYEKDTEAEIARDDTYNDGVYKSKIVSDSKQKEIDGYTYDSADPVELEIKAQEGQNIIKLYYERRHDLQYTVNYIDKDTNEKIRVAKTQENKTFGDVVNANNEVVTIAGYNYDSASTPSITIGTNAENNVINLYYTKKTDLSYIVRHYEKDTTTEIAGYDTYNNGVFKSKIICESKQKEIDGYTYDSADPVELEIKAQESENIINLYYERRHDLQYTVNYIDKDTDEEIQTAKLQGNMTFGDVVIASNEVVTIDGYNYESASTPSITIGTNGANNVINLYYTKKTDLSYIVRHYEKDTTTEIAGYDTYNDGVFKSKVISESKQKEIDGYTYDSADPVELEIKAEGSQNIIKLYYERRHDLQYTVNYIDKDTNEKIRVAKTQENKTFGDVVTAGNEVVTIEGYNYDSASTPSITIGTNGANNVINLYYTKKTDLSYIVRYYEKDTTTEIAGYDTYNNGVFKSKIISESKQKEIDGYTYDSADPVELEIKAQESENVINLYYERRNDLQYTVKYLDKVTNEEIKVAKIQRNMTLGNTVIANDEKVEITGYNYNSSSVPSITIGTTAEDNIIILYYTKREDLNYTVKYYDKDTNEEIKTAKVTGEQIFDTEIVAVNEKVTIPGYNYNSASPETIRISTNAENNIINLYYTKRTDLSYVVNYLEKDNLTNILLEQKTKTGKTFKDIVYSVDEVVDIVGYVYNSADPETLEIEVEGNVINLLYVRRNDLKYHVNYIDVDKNEQIKETKTVPNKTYEETVISSTEIIDIDGYTFDSVTPESIQILVDEQENEINIYYKKRNDLQYTVNYIDKDTNEEIQTAKTQENMTFGDEVIASNEVVTIDGYNYESASIPSITIGTTAEDNVISLYYTKKTDLSYIVRHYEKDTTTEIAGYDTYNDGVFKSKVISESKQKEIDGYTYDYANPVELEIKADEEENVINLYYERRHDLQYKVNYIDKDTNEEIQTAKLQENMTFGDVVTARNEVITIDGYNYESASTPSITIGTTAEDNVISLYYTKRADLSYKVNYIDKDTNEEIQTTKTQGNMTFGDEVIASNEVVRIDGYNYESASIPSITIGTTAADNVISLYYTKKTDLSYIVNYLEKGTTTEIAGYDTYNDGVFKSKVISESKQKEINGYTYDSANPEELEISAQESENIINLYYERRHDLQYKVNYIDKDTNEEIQTAKLQEHMTYGDVVTASNEVVTIDGYNYESASIPSITIGTTAADNVISLYYTKKTDLSYIVRHYEKDTTTEIAGYDTYNDGVFKSKVISESKQKEINGYTYDSANPEELEISAQESENIINLYYERRHDLQYKVNYIDKDTNEEIQTAKLQEHMTYGDEVTASNEVVTIDGYNYESPSTSSITIGTTAENNVISLYYIKKTDLSYIVRHYEKDTTTEIAGYDTYNDGVFKSKVISESKQKEINGYTYDSANPEELEISAQESENIINLYYKRRHDLQYKVNYIDKDTNEEIQTAKLQEHMTYGDEVTASNEVVTIDGYNYESPSTSSITIGTNAEDNVIGLYYTKKTDLGYTVRYYEKGTTTEIAGYDTYNDGVFKSKVVSEGKQKTIAGYTYDSADPEELEIKAQESENVISLYYERKNDLQYTVNYIDKDTDEQIQLPKVQGDNTLGDRVAVSSQVVEIAGYVFDSSDFEELEIKAEESENVINLYYTKRNDLSYVVRYIDKDTNEEILENKTVLDQVYKDEIDSNKEIVQIYGYNFESVTPNTLTVGLESNIITIQYSKKPTQVIVHYYLDDTDTKVSENIIIDGKVNEHYETVPAKDVADKYVLYDIIGKPEGDMTEEVIHVIYKYTLKEGTVIAKYVDKLSGEEIADRITINDKYDTQYSVGPKSIEKYKLIEHTGNENGKIDSVEYTITYYYLHEANAKVQYVDVNTGRVLEEISTEDGLVGDKFETVAKDFEGYVLVSSPAEPTVILTEEDQLLVYGYVHVLEGVIEKHIDMITGETLYNEVHTGNEGDHYLVVSKTFEGYDLVEENLPENSEGRFGFEPIEVTYYYKYRSSVTAKYIDRHTGKELAQVEIGQGHEGDKYVTDRKVFDDYVLVEVPENADGELSKEPKVVTYYYKHTTGGVKVNHRDINTGKQLVDEIKLEGYEGDRYETEAKIIAGYDLVAERYPENAKGEMTIEPIEVTYYYIRKSSVIVQYVDEATNEVITEEKTDGHEGDQYEASQKNIEGYDLIQEPDNKIGEMSTDGTYVIFKYRRPTKVIVHYYDEELKKLADDIVIEGHEGDEYKTESKTFEYYVLEKMPENKDGTTSVEITEMEDGTKYARGEKEVIYKYRKQRFDLSIDKTISSVIVNGEETKIDGKLGKVEVHRKELSSSKVQVVYMIKVRNEGELEGKAQIQENIPEGMTMSKANNPEWQLGQTTATLDTEEIKPGQTKEYKVVLDWNNGESAIGTKENIAEIIGSENVAKFEDMDKTDDRAKATVIIAIGTGDSTYVLLTVGLMMILIGAGVVIWRRFKTVKWDGSK